MAVKLLTEHHLEFLSLTGGCIASSETIHVKIPHCWKFHVAAQMLVGPTHYQNHARKEVSQWDQLMSGVVRRQHFTLNHDNSSYNAGLSTKICSPIKMIARGAAYCG